MVIEGQGIIITQKSFQESKIIVTFLLEEHGLKRGLMRKASKNRSNGIFPGSVAKIRWTSRLEEHLGFVSIEVLESSAMAFCQNQHIAYIISSMLELCYVTLRENDIVMEIYSCMKQILHLSKIAEDLSCLLKEYIKFEMRMLEHLGFGLDLNKCAATGVTSDLMYISPKSGRAVSAEAGYHLRDKLFKMPSIFSGHNSKLAEDMLEALNITGYFLGKYLHLEYGKALPLQRTALQTLSA